MADTITVKFKVLEDGSFQQIGADAEKAAKSTDKASKSSDHYSKKNKGVAQAGMNSTKAFSKMTTGIEGGLVPAYATLAAHVFAVTAAFGVLERAAGVKQLNEGLLFTGRAAGENLTLVSEGLVQITDNAVSAAEAMKSVALGTSAGFDQTQMEGLARVAKGAAQALGRDMTDALDRLTRGAAKLEPEILDELGIMVRLDDATQKYADKLGVAVSSLSQFERRMAFTNEIIEQGGKKFGALSQTMESNPFNQLAATFDNLIKTGTIFMNSVLGPIAGFLAGSMPTLLASMAVLGTGVINKMVPGLLQAGEASAKLAGEMAETSKQTLKSTKAFKGAPKAYTGLVSKLQKGTASKKQYKSALDSLRKSVSLHEKQMVNYIKIHGQESVAVKTKEKKLNEAKGAIKSLTAAQELETLSTQKAAQAKIMAAAATGSFKDTYVLLKAEIMRVWAATTLDTVGKGFLTIAYARLRDAVLMATLSLKAFGLTLLQSLPVLGQIVLAGYLLKDVFLKFFPSAAKEVSIFADALENSKKRAEEYPNIIQQMANTYAHATTNSERYIIAQKTINGLLKQGLAQVKEFKRVEELAARTKQVAAKRELKALEEKKTKAEEVFKKTSFDPANIQTGFLAANMQTQASRGLDKSGDSNKFDKTRQDRVKELADAMTDYQLVLEELGPAQQAFNESSVLPKASDERVAAVAMALGETKNAISLTIGEMEKGSEEFIEANDQLDSLTGLLDNLSAETLPAAEDALESLSNKSDKTTKSFQGLIDIGQEIDALFTKNAQRTGDYSEQIRLLDKVEKELARTNRSAAQDEAANSALSSFGITRDELSGALGLKDQFIALADAKKQIGYLDEEQVQRQDALNAAGLEQLAMEERHSHNAYKLSLAQEDLRLGRIAGLDVSQKELEVLKQLGQEEKDRLETIKQRTEEANQNPLFGQGVEAGGFMEANKDKFNDPAVATSEKIGMIGEAMKPMMEQAKKLGPDGEVAAAVMEGALQMGETFMGVFEQLEEGTLTFQSGLQAASAIIGAIGQMQAANAKKQVADIDRMIAAEKKKDGKSEESMQKIASMEAKKTAIKRKAFEQDKKMKMAQVVMATASAIMTAIQGPPGLPWSAVFGTMAAAMGAAQLSAIAQTTFQGGGGAGAAAPSKLTVGQRQNTVDLAKANNAGGEISYMRGAQGTGKGATDYKPAFSGYKHRAGGGYLVGEQGPELFMPDVPGEILQSGQSPQSSPNVNFSINAVDSTGVEDLLVNQKGHIIRMIREAANEHGESFLESVSDSEYGGQM